MSLKSMDTVGVQFVNEIMGSGIVNGVVNLQFGTYQFTPAGDKIEPDLVTSCRLRMDIQCAKQLYSQLDHLLEIQAAQVSEVETEKPN